MRHAALITNHEVDEERRLMKFWEKCVAGRAPTICSLNFLEFNQLWTEYQLIL